MIIGVLTRSFQLHGNDSLKGKRQVAQSLKQKLRNTFNVAVSEIEDQDAHQKLVLAVVTVSGETARVESTLSKAQALVEAIGAAELVNVDTEIFSSSGEND